jgi:diguanylate cyclase (GGDEF)-like protein
VTKKLALRNDIRRILLLGFGGIIILVLLIQVLDVYADYVNVAQRMRDDFVGEQKQAIKREVRRIVDRINYQKSVLEQKAAELAASRVELAEGIIRNMLQQHPDMPLAEVSPLILDVLKAVRYDDGKGYFFVTDQRGVLLMHAVLPNREGNRVQDLAGASGVSLRGFLEHLTGGSGEGMITYPFPKPDGAGTDFVKTTYAKVIEPLQWTIATGVYLDDLERQVKTDLLDEIQQMRFGANGYIFVDNWQGVVLAHGAQPELVGNNIWEHKDPDGVKVVQKLIAAAKTPEGDYIRYGWKKPGTDAVRPKILFAMGIPDWQWMIGTGVYVDEFDEHIAAVGKIIYQGLATNLLVTITAILLAGLLFYIWLNRGYGFVVADLGRFNAFFNRAGHLREPLDGSVLRYTEHIEMARHVNAMLNQKLLAERDLREYQARLEDTVRHRTEQLEEKTRELENLASLDSLTGAMNRRAFLKSVQRELSRAARHDHNLSLLFLDIDRFKQVNDRFGHAAGDEVLRVVVKAIRQRIRVSDLVARWGGEEFIVLAPETDAEGATGLAESIRELVSALEIPEVGQVTCSLGMALWDTRETFESLCARADAALYQAKQAGRNRVCSS